MATEAASYGSIEKDDKTFDPANMQYLGEGRPLSREEKIRKLIRVAVPLLVALLIMYVAASFLLNDFGHLYPGKSGDHGRDHVVVTNGPSSTTTATTTASSDHSPHSEIDPKCIAHEECSGLIGNCCPTDNGVILDCCR